MHIFAELDVWHGTGIPFLTIKAMAVDYANG
jgi:hypothetical protein